MTFLDIIHIFLVFLFLKRKKKIAQKKTYLISVIKQAISVILTGFSSFKIQRCSPDSEITPFTEKSQQYVNFLPVFLSVYFKLLKPVRRYFLFL